MRFIAIAATTAFVFLSATQVQAQSSKNSSDTYKQLELFGTVLDRIRSDYVEEVSDAELIKAAIDGMLTLNRKTEETDNTWICIAYSDRRRDKYFTCIVLSLLSTWCKIL